MLAAQHRAERDKAISERDKAISGAANLKEHAAKLEEEREVSFTTQFALSSDEDEASRLMLGQIFLARGKTQATPWRVHPPSPLFQASLV